MKLEVQLELRRVLKICAGGGSRTASGHSFENRRVRGRVARFECRMIPCAAPGADQATPGWSETDRESACGTTNRTAFQAKSSPRKVGMSTPIELIVKFVNADITSAELIDGGIELLNGNGIRAPLAAEKEPHQALLSYQNWIWWRSARSFRSVLETVHAMLPCRTMRYFRADCNMTGLMTKCSA